MNDETLDVFSVDKAVLVELTCDDSNTGNNCTGTGGTQCTCSGFTCYCVTPTE